MQDARQSSAGHLFLNPTYLFYRNLGEGLHLIAIQVFHNKPNHILTGGGIQGLPGKHITAKGQRTTLLGNCLGHNTLRIQVHPMFGYSEGIAGLRVNLAGGSSCMYHH